MDSETGIIPFTDGLSRKVRIAAPYRRYMTCRVKSGEAGLEITRFLGLRFPFRSRDQWIDRLLNDSISQGGRILRPGDRIAASPHLSFFSPSFTEPSVPDEMVALEESKDYLLVYKPAPMPVHPGGRYNKNTLTSILNEYGYQKSRTKILHRLDAVTSGIILFGLNNTFARNIQSAFASGTVTKSYLCVVSGNPDQDRITIDRPVQRSHGFRFKISADGKPSKTHFEVLRRGTSTSIVKCTPVTGRTHQIRLHLREWGHPVADDPVYGFGTGSSNPENSSGTRPGRNNHRVNPADAIQNTGISLIHYRLRFPDLSLDCNLFDFFSQPDGLHL